ncbi:LLM class flavin-dependent oxidoreductase [Parafrankia discariae]|uniref:LLM class flavin-dependent oxidoreductase n=1 Tax=Parafrankia discariae TaxID=365528 RepID=UPI003898F8C5
MRARPAPIPLAAAVAAVTSRIRLGFSALHVAQYDPIRLAADLATLRPAPAYRGRWSFRTPPGNAGSLPGCSTAGRRDP